MSRGPAVLALPHIASGAGPAGVVDQVGDEALLARVVDLRQPHEGYLDPLPQQRAPGEFAGHAGIAMRGIEAVFDGLLAMEFSAFAVAGRPELGMVVCTPAAPEDVERVRQLVEARDPMGTK